MLNIYFEPVGNMFIFTLWKLNDLEPLKCDNLSAILIFVDLWFPRQRLLLKSFFVFERIIARMLSVFYKVCRSNRSCLGE